MIGPRCFLNLICLQVCGISRFYIHGFQSSDVLISDKLRALHVWAVAACSQVLTSLMQCCARHAYS